MLQVVSKDCLRRLNCLSLQTALLRQFSTATTTVNELPLAREQKGQSLTTLKPFTGLRALLGKILPAPVMCPTPVRNCAVRVYQQCTCGVDFVQFIEDFKLSDTFDAYFKVTVLHMWISLLRLAQEPTEYYVPMRDFIIKLMWDEMEKVKDMNFYTFKNQRVALFKEMFQGLQDSLVDLDEGILGDDRMLAGALWRRIYVGDPNVDFEVLYRMVYYVRAQVYRQAQISTQNLLFEGIRGWSLDDVKKLPQPGQSVRTISSSVGRS